MNHTLELTIKLENGQTDYDFVNVVAGSRQGAIEIHTKALNARIVRAKAGNQVWKQYVNWQGFELK